MAQKLFKGFKQVLKATYDDAVKNSQAAGYIWFVRTPKDDVTESELKSPLINDSYDIYFGTKHYGHFMDSEIPALATAIGNIKESIGLGAEYEFLCLPTELENVLKTDTLPGSPEVPGKVTITHAIEYIYKKFVKVSDFNDFKSANKIALDSKAGFAELSSDGKTISFYKDNSEGKGEALFTIDSSAFVKDGFLDDVEVTTPALLKKDIVYNGKTYHQATDVEKDTKFLHFTWKVTNYDKAKKGTQEKEAFKEDFVILSEIVTAYTPADESILISKDNKVKVGVVRTNATKTNTAIKIAGGPLADKVLEAYPGGTLPEGTDIQTLLMKLLCVEKWPESIAVKQPSHTASIEAPTITMSEGLIEVGSQVSVTVKNAESKHTVTNPKAYGFTYGYSASDNNTVESQATELVGSNTNGVKVEKSTLKVSGAVTGSAEGKVAAGSATITKSFFAVEGANTVSAENTSSTFTAKFNELPACFQCSNLGNTRSDDQVAKSTEKVEQVTIDTTSKTNSTSKTVTGVYPIFCNGVAGNGNGTHDAELANSLSAEKDHTKLDLMPKGGETFYVAFASQAVAPYTLYLPKGRTIVSAVGIDGLKGTYTLGDNHTAYKKKGSETIQVHGNGVAYDVYQFAGTQGQNGIKFVLNSL